MTEFVVTFGEGGDAGRFPGFGWAGPEAGHTWTDGAESGLMLPRPLVEDASALRLEIRPFLLGERVPAQRLTVLINGGEIGRFVVREAAVIECTLPSALVRRRHEWLSLTFQMPDAARPADISDRPDRREIAFAFRSLRFRARAGGGPPPGSAGLLADFESLGESREFGVVQSYCGVERPGLLRSAGAPLPVLIAALEARFAGIGEPDRVEVLVDAGAEYLVLDRCFGFAFRPGVRHDEIEPGAMRRDQAAQMRFARRLLIDDLTAGNRIFVYRGMRHLPRALIARLRAAQRSYGPNSLLWVDLHDAGHPPGSVEWLGEGMMKGYLDRFAAGDGDRPSLECWLTLCRQARQLHFARRAANAAEARSEADAVTAG